PWSRRKATGQEGSRGSIELRVRTEPRTGTGSRASWFGPPVHSQDSGPQSRTRVRFHRPLDRSSSHPFMIRVYLKVGTHPPTSKAIDQCPINFKTQEHP